MDSIDELSNEEDDQDSPNPQQRKKQRRNSFDGLDDEVTFNKNSLNNYQSARMRMRGMTSTVISTSKTNQFVGGHSPKDLNRLSRSISSNSQGIKIGQNLHSSVRLKNDRRQGLRQLSSTVMGVPSDQPPDNTNFSNRNSFKRNTSLSQTRIKTKDEYKKSSMCRICEQKWGVWKKQQFCQFCGHGVCKKCSERKYQNPQNPNQFCRICNKCAHKSIVHRMTKHGTSLKKLLNFEVHDLETELWDIKQQAFNIQKSLSDKELEGKIYKQKHNDKVQQQEDYLKRMNVRIQEYTKLNEGFNQKITQNQLKLREQEKIYDRLKEKCFQQEQTFDELDKDLAQKENSVENLKKYVNEQEQKRVQQLFGTQSELDDLVSSYSQNSQTDLPGMYSNFSDVKSRKTKNSSNYRYYETNNSISRKKRLFDPQPPPKLIQYEPNGDMISEQSEAISILEKKGCCSTFNTNKKCVIF